MGVQFHPEASPGPADTNFCSTTLRRFHRRSALVTQHGRALAAKVIVLGQLRAQDRRGRRVRLLGQPGHQGPQGGGHRHGAGQPEHRDDPDLRAPGRQGLLPARQPVLRRAKSSTRSGPTASCSASAGRPRSTAAWSWPSRGVFEKYGVKVLGTPVAAIEATEDRQLFTQPPGGDRRQGAAQCGRRRRRPTPCGCAQRARLSR